MADIRSNTVPGEIDVHVLEAGDPGAPAVLFLHGFPELAYSWRHQLPVIADAGYHAIAPDQRGFGRTGGPAEVTAYDTEHLAADALGVLDALGHETAIVVGHDWGADLAWKLALLHPDRVTAVAGMSVPHIPRAPAPPLAIMRRHLGEDFYIVWFQQPGVADAALGRDVRRTLTTRAVWTAAWASEDEETRLPRWLAEDDLAVYVDAFTRTGFTGGLNWYRNIDRNWAFLAAADGRTIDQPAMFLVGSRDPTRTFMPAEAMDGHVTDLRSSLVLEGAGHWVQQERPDEVNAALLAWLEGLGREPAHTLRGS